MQLLGMDGISPTKIVKILRAALKRAREGGEPEAGKARKKRNKHGRGFSLRSAKIRKQPKQKKIKKVTEPIAQPVRQPPTKATRKMFFI